MGTLINKQYMGVHAILDMKNWKLNYSLINWDFSLCCLSSIELSLGCSDICIILHVGVCIILNFSGALGLIFKCKKIDLMTILDFSSACQEDYEFKQWLK